MNHSLTYLVTPYISLKKCGWMCMLKVQGRVRIEETSWITKSRKHTQVSQLSSCLPVSLISRPCPPSADNIIVYCKTSKLQVLMMRRLVSLLHIPNIKEPRVARVHYTLRTSQQHSTMQQREKIILVLFTMIASPSELRYVESVNQWFLPGAALSSKLTSEHHSKHNERNLT